MNNILLTTCSTIVDAEILYDLLTKNGIQAEIVEKVLKPENIAVGGLDEFYYDIVIDEADLAKAQRLVSQFLKENEKDEMEGLWCPKCGGDNIEKLEVKRSRYANIGIWVICLILVVVAYKWARPYIASLDAVYFWIIFGILVFAVIGLYWLFNPHKTTKYFCHDCGHVFKKVS